ncbi:MAG: hypothetical protein AAF560_01065 [Acidobacteriota bacterium]
MMNLLDSISEANRLGMLRRAGAAWRRSMVIAWVSVAWVFGLGAQEAEPFKGTVKPPSAEDSEDSAKPYREAEVVTARIAESGRPGHRKVQGVRVLVDGAGRMDWSQQGDWIAFDRADSSGFYHLYKMKPNGSREKCLTCDIWDFRKTNSLSPSWHPSGEYLVFQVQEHANKLQLDTLRLTTPHRGLHSEIWIISADGKAPFKLTQTRERGAAVLDPHFSHEASKLVWSQRVVSLGRWGEWEPHVAEFKIRRGVPRISKVKSYQPGLKKGFVVAHGFTPNDRGLLISGGRSSGGRDILELDLESGTAKPLTTTSRELDELAFALPRADGVVWVSSRNIEPPAGRVLPRQGDVWYMSASKRRQERLTFFNDPQSDHFLGEALIDDLAWSPEGDQLLVHVVSPGSPGSETVSQAIYVVELDGAFGT